MFPHGIDRYIYSSTDLLYMHSKKIADLKTPTTGIYSKPAPEKVGIVIDYGDFNGKSQVFYQCPSCLSMSWRRRKTDKKYVCLKCGEVYAIIIPETNNNH